MIRALILCLALSGCAQAPYWFFDGQVYKGVYYPPIASDNIMTDCQTTDWNQLGCAWRNYGIIYYASWLNEKDRDCVISHERKHLAGWEHDRKPTFELEC